MKRHFLLLLVFSFLCLHFSCTPEARSDKTIETPFDTIAELTKLIDKHPENADYLYKRSYQYFIKRKVDVALQDIDKAIIMEPKNDAFFHMRGYYKYVVGNIDDALKDFNQASYLSSTNPETYYQIANIAVLKENYAQSLQPYDHAIKLDPKDPQYPFGKAFALRKLRRTDEAIKACLISLESDSSFIKSLNLIFEIYLNDKQDLERAAFYNQRMLTAHPNLSLAHFNTGLLFYKKYELKSNTDRDESLKSLKQSINAYDQAIKLQPDYSKAYYQRGFMYFKLEIQDKALDDFQKTVELDPQNEQAFFMMGSIYESYKEKQKARKCYEKAVSINPNWHEAQAALKQLDR